MSAQILYLLVLFFELFISIGVCIFVASMLYSFIKGAPYVPTSKKEIDVMLEAAELKKNQYFLELGSGDGRVTRSAVEKYHVIGKGIDVSPLLVWQANLLAKWQKLSTISFEVGDVRTTDLSTADVIYIFLLPELIVQFKDNLLYKTKQGTLIISHGFEIPFLKEYLIKTLERKPYPTYYYRIGKK